MINSKTIALILGEVKTKLPIIFSDNLMFGFVCGGFSKGYADENHDIDIFACLKNQPSPKKIEEYLKWYFDIHHRYGAKPDTDYPGELVTHSNLMETLKILNDLHLTLEIKEIKTKKAIIWADMISGKTAAETGPFIKLLFDLKKTLKKYPPMWKRGVLALIPENERLLWKNKSHLLIMEHYMKYPKYDGLGLKNPYR